MDIEQLKLILDTLSGLGGDAKDFAIWWLVADKLLPVVSVITVVGLVGAIVVKVVRIASGVSLADVGMRELRDLLGVGSSGRLVDSETREVIRRVTEMKRELETLKHE